MASILKVDALQGVTAAGSILVTGEGNSTTTNLQQGLAKAWINFDGSSPFAIKNSFNGSSVTDRGAAQYTASFTNVMNDTSYAISGSMGFDNVNGTGYFTAPPNTAIGTWKTTSSNRMDFYHGNLSKHGSDADDVADIIHGDLA
jgi:hypothetical protein